MRLTLRSALRASVSLIVVAITCLGHTPTTDAAPNAPTFVYVPFQALDVNTNLPVGGNSVTGFAVDSNGNLSLIASYATGGVGSPDLATTAQALTVIGQYLYVGNAESNDVSAFSIDAASGGLTLLGIPVATGGIAHGVGEQGGISMGATSDGKLLLVTSRYSSNITVYNILPNGTLSPVAGPPIPSGGISAWGVTISPDNALALVQLGGKISVFSIDPSGSLTPVPGSPFTTAPGPGAAAINCAGNRLFFGSASVFVPGRAVNVLEVASSGALTPIPGSPFGPTSPANDISNSAVSLLSPDGSRLFVTNQQDSTISVFDVAPGGSLMEATGSAGVPGSPFSTGASTGGFGTPNGTRHTSFPGHMATDLTGTFLITKNLFEVVVQRIVPSTGQLVVWDALATPSDGLGVWGSLAAYPAGQCNTPSGNNVDADLAGGDAVAGGVTVTFSAVTTTGNTILTPGSCPSLPTSFLLGQPPVCYELTTTAVYTPPIEVCINYSGISFGLGLIRLLHYEAGAWADVTTQPVDTANQIVCGEVNGLSPFVVAETVGAPAPPSIAKVFGAAAITLFGETSLTFMLHNPSATALTGIGFTDTLPGGLIVATPHGLTTSCGGAVTAASTSSSVALTGGTLAAGGSCIISVKVFGTTVGVKVNTTGNVTSTEGGSGNTASASLTVESPAGKRDCRGKLVSALARQFGGIAQAAAALGFAGVRDLQQAVLAACPG